MRFDELDLEDEILDGLEDMNFHEMTPVQEHTIPVILEGRDIIGCAQTGTGKTAAYTLPLLNKLLIEGNPDNVVKSLIIVPTRELAQQIDQQFQGFSYYAPLSTTVVYGGGDGKGWDIQKNGMLNGADVVIATPGRMIAHLQNSGVDLSHVEYLILDEADRMLDMGFSDDIMKIISYMPAERQTIMFSATLPPKIRELAKTILRNPAEVNIAISKPNEAIDQSAYICYERQKLGIIRELFAEPTDSKTIIFSSSKLKVKELAHTLKRMGLDVAAMHSDLEQAQREEVMLNFKNNKVKILVATDIVARGIDIEDIGLVLNYDVPHDPEDYIHRIGRTARAGADGTAVSFCAPEEMEYLAGIEKLNRRKIPVVSGHPWDGVPAPVKAAPPVRGRKPKAEQPAPEKAETPKAEKAAKPAAPEKKSAAKPSAAKKQKAPKIEAKEEQLMDDNKRTPGGRDNSRRNNNNRPRREGNAPAQGAGRGSNAQPKFDPHFVSAPEATPLRSAKKNAATPAAPIQTIPTAMQNRQPAQRSENNGRNGAGRSPRNERNDRSARPAQPAQQNSQRNENRNGRSNNRNEQSGAGRAPRAPKAEQSGRNNRSRSNNVPTKDEDPGLVLISRRPPQQKFTSFEEYMNAHGGETAPIEDHSEEV